MTGIAHWHANYPGNINPVGQIVGPNTMHEYFMAVSAEYNEEKNTTRVGFAIAAMDG